MAKKRELLRIERDEKAIVVGFAEHRIADTETINNMVSGLLDAADSVESGGLILDFTDVIYVSSAFLGALVRVNKRTTENGGVLLLCCMAEDIRKLFQITGLDRIMAIHPKVEIAKSAVI